MSQPDLSKIEPGSIFGISMFNSVRVIAIAERVNEGVVRARCINGQYPIAFLTEKPRPGFAAHRGIDNWRDAAMVNGDWAKGMEIAFVGDIPAEYRDVLVKADQDMQGKNYGTCKRIYEMIEPTYKAALSFMNKSIELDREPAEPEQSMPGMRF